MITHLENHGISNVTLWGRGVDREIFKPCPLERLIDRPYIICVSRVSHEKNLDAFCQLNHPCKVLVGDGPYLDELKGKYPEVQFLGKMEGPALAGVISHAQVFVFPSKTDTFGIVILEAIACGTPVAAYPEPGPLEVIVPGWNGYHTSDLQRSVDMCIAYVVRTDVLHSSQQWTWERATTQFLEGVIQ
jgi:glycosyltransferase involved in cell wall biosynthesis